MQTPEPYTPSKLVLHQPHRRAVISLTPLIDVVFILLVFFMLASSFLDWRSITLDTVLPPPSSRQATDQRPLLLSVSAEQTRLNGEPLSMDVLLPRLQQRLDADPNATVRVQPLGDTSLQAVVAVLDELKLAGITRLAMVRDRSWSVSGDVKR